MIYTDIKKKSIFSMAWKKVIGEHMPKTCYTAHHSFSLHCFVD